MRKTSLVSVALTSFLILTFSALGWAQSGSIAGTVSDTSGAVIPGAQVSVRDAQTGIVTTTRTNSQGFYEFLNVKPSSYELTIEMKGFDKAIKRDISVIVGHEAHFDVTLTPGNVSETIEVKTEVPLIEPDKTNVAYSIDKQQIENLPLQGRQFLDLALLTPGVTPQAPGTQAGGINVSGMRSQSNNFTLDGVSRCRAGVQRKYQYCQHRPGTQQWRPGICNYQKRHQLLPWHGVLLRTQRGHGC
jgi:hypothetical protein